MGQTSNKAKQQWNARNYRQVKISVAPETAAAFKAACASSGESMASAMSQFMLEYSHARAPRKADSDYSSRRKRRAAVKKLVGQLTQIMDAESDYADRIPEGLQGSSVHERAADTISVLGEALEQLESAY
jgi:hypothetical protein